jgi:PAS domain S-box-containing protein
MSCDYLSPAWSDFTGLGAEDPARAIHPDDLIRWLHTCVRAFDERTPFEIEYRLRRRDGEYRWVLEQARPRFGEDGAFEGYVIQARVLQEA